MYTKRNQKEQQEAGHSMQIIDSLAPMRSNFFSSKFCSSSSSVLDAIVTGQSIFQLPAFFKEKKT
jgi:hypothetical protein